MMMPRAWLAMGDGAWAVFALNGPLRIVYDGGGERPGAQDVVGIWCAAEMSRDADLLPAWHQARPALRGNRALFPPRRTWLELRHLGRSRRVWRLAYGDDSPEALQAVLSGRAPRQKVTWEDVAGKTGTSVAWVKRQAAAYKHLVRDVRGHAHHAELLEQVERRLHTPGPRPGSSPRGTAARRRTRRGSSSAPRR